MNNNEEHNNEDSDRSSVIFEFSLGQSLALVVGSAIGTGPWLTLTGPEVVEKSLPNFIVLALLSLTFAIGGAVTFWYGYEFIADRLENGGLGWLLAWAFVLLFSGMFAAFKIAFSLLY